MTVPRMRQIGTSGLASPTGPRREFSIAPPSTARLRFAQRPVAGRAAQKPMRAIAFVLMFITGVFGLCIWASIKLSPQLAWNEVDFAAPRGAAWSRQAVSPSTSKGLPRRLILYRQIPAAAGDWRMEFNWKSDQTGIGLIVRCADRRNYSAVRLRPIADGFSEESFRVVEGVDGSHSLKKIIFPKSNPDLHVTVEETGHEVALRLGQENIDRWTEIATPDRIGFFEERSENVTAHAIQISRRNHPSLRAILVEARRIAQSWWNSLSTVHLS